MGPVCVSLGVARRDRELARQILMAHRRMVESLTRKKRRPSLVQRQYFHEALVFLGLTVKARGGDGSGARALAAPRRRHPAAAHRVRGRVRQRPTAQAAAADAHGGGTDGRRHSAESGIAVTRRGKGPLDPEALLRLGTSEHYEDPELYDFEYRDHRHDVAWYRGLARDRGPRQRIVELGAGTGRISLPLCHDGHSVVAVDRMPTMLDHLRRKARRPSPATSPPASNLSSGTSRRCRCPTPIGRPRCSPLQRAHAPVLVGRPAALLPRGRARARRPAGGSPSTSSCLTSSG